MKAIGAFSSVFLGVCSLAIGNVNAAETKSNETYQDAETLLVTGEKVKRSIFDTSSSVQVFDSNRIASMPDAVQIPDLLRMTPTWWIWASATNFRPCAVSTVPVRTSAPTPSSAAPARASTCRWTAVR
ncbi:hypothetical protein M8494_35830 [Serratia ureilytica]